MDLMETEGQTVFAKLRGANVHGFFSRYAAELSGRTETLTSRTAADDTASTSTASASRSQRTARKSFDLSFVGRALCTRFSSPLTSVHARPKRDAPHEETGGLCFTSFRGQRHQGYREDGCLPGNIGMRGRLLESGRFYSSSIRRVRMKSNKLP